MRKQFVAFCLAFIVLFSWGGQTQATAADTVRVAVLATGTFSWELAVVKAYGLDRASGIRLEVTDLASPEAGKVALMGGAADVIISDWLWTARERSLGNMLTFYPYSSALGSVVVAPKTSIRSIADLSGKRLGVAGGPLDKSWLMLQAAAQLSGIDLKTSAKLVYGAPPLLAKKLEQGELDATLEFWNFAAILADKGMVRVIKMTDIEKALGAKGKVAATGYVFSDAFAAQHADLIARFLTMMRKAKGMIVSSDAAFAKIKPLFHGADESLSEDYRKEYSEGVPVRPIAAEEADAKIIFKALIKAGGAKLIGKAVELPRGTFYHGDAGPGAP